MKNILILLIISFIMSGCMHPAPKEMSRSMNSASIGMTKQQVIQSMGEPNSVSAINGTVYMNYLLCEKTASWVRERRCILWNKYYVRLRNAKVDSYGKLGDFDSTKVPEKKHTFDVNIK